MLSLLRLPFTGFGAALIAFFASIPVSAQVSVDQFVNYESAHVHPLELTPDGSKLLAVNTANNTLEVFNVNIDGTLQPTASISVGHDPVSVRARSNTEVWVANVISDSISIVDLNINAVVQTLKTQDEPSDIAFAGSPERAFVSCAEREIVQVFDLADLSAQPQEVWLFGEQPRALAVSPDGGTVYAAFFESGNQTTVVAGNQAHATGQLQEPLGRSTVTANEVTNPAGPYGGQVPVPNDGDGFDPPLNPDLPVKTDTQSLVVKKQPDGRWLDDNNGDWTAIVSGGQGNRVNGWDMKDRDVAMIDTDTLGVTYQRTLGNILMALSVNPSTGNVFVVGTDALNHIRFEPNLNGTFIRHQVSSFSPGDSSVNTVDLNSHLDYVTPTVSNPEKLQSIGDPRAVSWVSDGSRAYISGMGSNNVITIDGDGNRAGAGPIVVGEGPTGIAIHEASRRVFVLNKFSATISSIDLDTSQNYGVSYFYDPTPEVIKTGRPHLYNTFSGSGNGTIACASCHVDAKWDRLAWDLGDPSGEMETVDGRQFHPLKGLKVTQSLIDIIGRGNLHWRGDRTEFRDFHLAFENLKGREPVSEQAMAEFEAMIATTYYPPNPYKARDRWGFTFLNSLGVRGAGLDTMDITFAGNDMAENYGNLFYSTNWDRFCGTCHKLGSGRGTDRIGDNITADLRSVYKKLGYFIDSTESTAGFGLMADGIFDTARLDNSFGTGRYLIDYPPMIMTFGGPKGDALGRNGFNGIFLGNDEVQGSHPAVGMQETLSATVGDNSRVAEMLALADGNRWGPVGLIVKGLFQGEQRGFVYTGSNNYQADSDGQTVSHIQLVSAAQADNSEPLTWTVVHEHTANRLGIDSNANGILNMDDFPDRDSDGVADETDLFPDDPSESADADGDGIGNNADEDDDNDSVPDNEDPFPLDPSEWVDTDTDGVGNNADEDDDNDGVADTVDAFPLDDTESLDTDSDGVGNNTDDDDDNDSVLDTDDVFPLDPGEWLDTDSDGIGNNADEDDDGDGVGDLSDLFPLDASESADVDNDGTGDNADRDDDNDGIPDTVETGVPLDEDINNLLSESSDVFASASSGEWVSISRAEYEALANTLRDVSRFGTSQGAMQSGPDTPFNVNGESMFSFAQSTNPSVSNINFIAFKRSTTEPSQGDNDIVRLSPNNNGQGFAAIGNPLPAGAVEGDEEYFVLKGSDETVFRTPMYLGMSTDQTNTIRWQAADTAGYGLPGSTADMLVNSWGWAMQGLAVVARGVNADKDGDSVPNMLDLDSDNDGLSDVSEAGGTDADSDGVIDNFLEEQGSLQNPPDSDNNNLPDFLDANGSDVYSNPIIDTDGDGWHDYADPNNLLLPEAPEQPEEESEESPEDSESTPTEPLAEIIIDGNFDDWSEVREIATDADDITGENNLLDIRSVSLVHDEEMLYMLMDTYDEMRLSWGLSMQMDTDNDIDTGFRGFTSEYPLGVDYMIEGNTLHEYRGSGEDFSWDEGRLVEVALSANSIEVAIPRGWIGEAQTLRVFFLAKNEAVNGDATDFVPDVLTDESSDQTLRFYSYDLSSPSVSEAPNSPEGVNNSNTPGEVDAPSSSTNPDVSQSRKQSTTTAVSTGGGAMGLLVLLLLVPPGWRRCAMNHSG